MLQSKLIEDAKYANYSYFAMLIMGFFYVRLGLLLIWTLPNPSRIRKDSIEIPETPWQLVVGLIMLLGGSAEVLAAIFFKKIGFVDLINLGMYEDAIQYFDEEKDTAALVVFQLGFLGGLIPAILLRFAANRLALALSMNETSYRICPHCGAKMPSSAKFCGKCGTRYE